MDIAIETVPALNDNYVYLVGREGSPARLVIDPSDAGAVNEALTKNGLRLGLILNTHHHHDHVGGNLALKSQWNAPVFSSKIDFERVPGADRGLEDGESFEFDGIKIETVAIPGHTRGQVAYHVPHARVLFVGDTVFAMGCGRLFEGSPADMWASLQKISSYPSETLIGVGHEYTERNAAFAQEMESDNVRIQPRVAKTKEEVRARGFASMPELRDELATNPFFRPHSPSIRKKLGMESATDLEVFAKLRELRNQF